METIIATHDESNKENIPPLSTNEANNNINIKKKKKKKNSIPPIAPSFKKNSKRKTKRIPLADITNLFNHSSPSEQIGVSPPPSATVLLHSTSRRRTLAVASASKSLRMGFR